MHRGIAGRAGIVSFSVLLGSLLTGLPAEAQFPLPGAGRMPGDDNRATHKLAIKRATMAGTVATVEPDRKLFTMKTGKAEKARSVGVDVGPALLKAGKGGATFADIKVGDNVTVWGEVTAQGGLRAMEITLPKERMSVPPVKPVKPDLKMERAEEKARLAEEHRKAEADRKVAEENRKAKAAEKRKAKEGPKAGGVKVDEPMPGEESGARAEKKPSRKKNDKKDDKKKDDAKKDDKGDQARVAPTGPFGQELG